MVLLFQGGIFRFQPLVLVRFKVSSPAFQKNPPFPQKSGRLTPRICVDSGGFCFIFKAVSKVGSSDVYRARYIWVSKANNICNLFGDLDCAPRFGY